MRIFGRIGKGWDYIAHRRMIAFWGLMVVMLPLPWLVASCSIGPNKQAHLDTCQVQNIYDGDTMTVNCQGRRTKIRLYCIDAPEIAQRPWGKESRDYLRSITPVTVQIRPIKKDRYGRVVAEVTSSGVNLNKVQVEVGHAAVYRKYCSDRGFYKREEIAKSSSIGIWERPGLQQSPWIYRQR